MKQVIQILIIKLSSLGDIVHALPAINLLAANLPEAKIDCLVYRKFARILEGQKNINQLHILPDKKLSTYLETAKKIRNQKYDYVIDLQGLIKTATLAFVSGARSFGFEHPREQVASLLYGSTALDKSVLDNDMHIVEKNLALAKSLLDELGVKKVTDEIDFGFDFDRVNLKNVKKKICLIPATTWESKFWPLDYWSELITKLKNQMDCQIFIAGSSKDLLTIENIVTKLKVPFNLVIDRDLLELAELFLEIDIVVGVDTGPLHIAAAVNYDQRKYKQVLGLYGPTSGKRTGPYGFTWLSVDEFTELKASHKRGILQDGASMHLIKPEMVLDFLL